jgi:type IV pilus assembly protein PilB
VSERRGKQRMRVGEALVAGGALSEDQLKDALARQQSTGEKLGAMLVDEGVISTSTLVQALAKCLDVRGVQLRHGLIDPALL